MPVRVVSFLWERPGGPFGPLLGFPAPPDQLVYPGVGVRPHPAHDRCSPYWLTGCRTLTGLPVAVVSSAPVLTSRFGVSLPLRDMVFAKWDPALSSDSLDYKIAKGGGHCAIRQLGNVTTKTQNIYGEEKNLKL